LGAKLSNIHDIAPFTAQLSIYFFLQNDTLKQIKRNSKQPVNIIHQKAFNIFAK